MLDLTASTAALRTAVTSSVFTTANLHLANQGRLQLGAGGAEMLFELADAATRFRWGINNVEIARWNATGLSLTSSGATAANPSTLVDLQTGAAGSSGLRFRNLTSASTPTGNTAYLAVDASGNVVMGAPGFWRWRIAWRGKWCAAIQQFQQLRWRHEQQRERS